MDYKEMKKLEEELLQQLTEGSGPTDLCLCSVLGPRDDERASLKSSLKKAFGFGSRDKAKGNTGKDIESSLSSSSARGKGFKVTREAVKRSKECGKCGCDEKNIVLRHSEANIRIVTPDISTLCPCSSNCLPGKEKMRDNIRVIIEPVQIELDQSTYSRHPNEDNSIINQSSLERFNISDH
ncbi:uncharacterized protein LOC101744840 [Bombyx mori]|uniref:Uncharacterized protein n=1 Tax=Bombyx mori TaxID=7091 RepID=A0A8R2DLH5_BOMMO|nr:uncharacterized protein LOC101744840 [Bombyx mori]XP_021203784.1 uncharacterized protein LOC101744840 [Bombyx mori]XP_021203785.1 uncharacterized protein LOC101744840 [Bombyx mori]